MPRVIVLCEYPTLNGGEHSLLAMLPGLQQRGFDVHVACPAVGPLAAAVAARSVAILPWGANQPPRAATLDVRRASLADWFHEHFARVRPDLLHANSLSLGRLVAPLAAEQGWPCTAHLRDIGHLSQAAANDLNQLTGLVAVSQATRAWHLTQGLRPERVVVIANGIDLNQFRPGPRTGWLHTLLGLPSQAILAGTIGQLVMRKGQDVLLAALPQIVANLRAAGQPPFHLVIVGLRYSEKAEAHCYEQQLRQAADHQAVRGHVHFLGYQAQVARLLAELDLLIHPARQEPLGRVLLEAAACGVPIIATAVGGTSEIFPPESDSACLIPADDQIALAGAVNQLLADPVRRGNLAKNARHRIATAFEVTEQSGRLADYWERCLAYPGVSK